ncbi:PRC-barrel domain-containing protein [Bosea sp. ASV33]|uniref:PRC-barrel domain-containing protein n=1 Tax=Bosea sp. ASV33 TaxID=2795106 RepID=UPI0018ECBD76|nr:PRC-barrel domain-containing protein [Bosea sp. ASV33]
MKRSTTLIAATALLIASAAMPAFAQGAKQTVALTEINPMTLATGYRSSKLVGATVYNDAKENISKVDDLIVTSKDSVPYAVLSVGGFLGMAKQHVVVAASALTVVDGRITLNGGSRDSLKALPNYSYTY